MNTVQKMRLPAALLAVCGTSLFAAGRARPEREVRPIPSHPVMQMSGAYSKIASHYYAGVVSEREWDRIWTRHTGQTETILGEGGTRLNVDFERYAVLAVFQGTQAFNLGVVAQSVTEFPDKVVVRYTNRWVLGGEPTPAHAGPAYTPFGLFVIPRTGKEVILEEAVYGTKAQPTAYAVRARFHLDVHTP